MSDKSSINRVEGLATALPSPFEVREQARVQDTDVAKDSFRPDRVKFPERGLLVKRGSDVTIAEGQCLWALKRLLPEVPVPEIYGWATEGDYVLLYMELIDGVTVEKRWPLMTENEKTGFWKGVRAVVDSLRNLSQESNDHFIGK